MKQWLGGLVLLILLTVLTGAVGANGDQPALIIEIPATVTVPGPGVTLGDLATIQGAGATELEALQKISLGPAPAPGQARSFTRGYLRLILQQHGFHSRLTLNMKEQVVVRVAGVCIQAADFEAALTGLLPPKRPGIIKKWLELNGLPEEIQVGRDEKWRLEPAVIGNWPEVGPVLFKVTLIVSKTGSGVAGETPKKRCFYIRGKIRETALLYRSIRDIACRRELQSADFERVELELATGREWVGEFPAKTRSTKFIKRGEVLRDDFLQPIPPVLKEHPVAVIVRGSGVELRITGIAKSDGWPGDEIQVVNQTSKKIFRARVIGEAMVEVTVR